MTALAVAEQEPRVKAVFTFDPWLYARKDDILNKKFVIKQPQVHVITQGFSPTVEKFFHYSTEDVMAALFKASESSQKQLIYLKDCSHYHQTDAICIVPIEVFVKTRSRTPQTNVADIYLLNT